MTENANQRLLVNVEDFKIKYMNKLNLDCYFAPRLSLCLCLHSCPVYDDETKHLLYCTQMYSILDIFSHCMLIFFISGKQYSELVMSVHGIWSSDHVGSSCHGQCE